MSNTGLAATRRTTDTTAALPASTAEFVWPPTSDDLKAIEVVAFNESPEGLAALAASCALRPAVAALDLRVTPAASTDSVELVLFDASGDQALEAFGAEGLPPPAMRVGRRRRGQTRQALAAAACIVVALALGRAIWRPLVVADDVTQRLPAGTRSPASALAQGANAVADTIGAERVNDRPALAGLTMTTDAPLIDPRKRIEATPPTTLPARVQASGASSPLLEPPLSQTLGARPPQSDAGVPEAAPTPTDVPLVPADETRWAGGAAPASGIAAAVPVPPAFLPTTATPVPAAALRGVPTGVVPAVDVPASNAVPTSGRSDELNVQATLRRYEAAYARLDARAAQAVWPSVDVRALARAFDDLHSQSLQFDRCAVDVQGATAIADCEGRATYVRRIGNKAPRTEARAWHFTFRKVGDEWEILRAAIR